MTTTITPEQADTIPAEAIDLDALAQALRNTSAWLAALDYPGVGTAMATCKRAADALGSLARRAAVPSEQEPVAWVHNLTKIVRFDKPSIGLKDGDYTPLYAHPSEQGEAVAWVFELAQARHQRTGEWVHFGPPQLSFTKPNVPDGSIRNLCPLVRPAPAAGVRVKALEWVRSSWARPNYDGTLSRRAVSVFGTYRVWTNPETGKWFWRLSDAPLGRESSGTADNEPAAKAAAQADYESRILSALDTGEPK